MFERIIIERDIKKHPRLEHILSKLGKNQKDPNVIWCDSIESVFNRYKKPYLQKRDNLNLFIGKKGGRLLKETPPAYGTKSDKHYYFIHAYNCIYECNYCYLQAYFNSPDLVFFINHEEIIEQMINLSLNQTERIWFHAGEFSDSLALSHITGELPLYFEAMNKIPNAFLELRTKSANTKEVEKLPPQKNVIISYSLASEKSCKANDLKVPPLSIRLKAMKKLWELGHTLAIHLDPIIYDHNLLNDYEQLLDQIESYFPLNDIAYFSLGVVRFPKDMQKEVLKNYPDALFARQDMAPDAQGIMRYPLPLRNAILKNIKNLCIQKGVGPDKIYLCMEEETENVSNYAAHDNQEFHI